MRSQCRFCHVCLIALIASGLLLPRQALEADREITNRVALVIGNAQYPDSPLKNPNNDARDMADALKESGFKTILVLDATRTKFKESLNQFLSGIDTKSEALFYYAGHAIQVGGVNYLLPTDYRIESEEDVPSNSIQVDWIMQKLEEKRTRLNIVILDSCRNDPFTRAVGRGGLATVNAPSGTLVAFATAPGRVAHDGHERNGLYTKHLLKAIRVPGVKIEDALKRVRIGVEEESHGKQVPWENTSLKGDFYFFSPQGDDRPSTTLSESAEARIAKEAIQIGNKTAMLDYLKQYPHGEQRTAVSNQLWRSLQQTPLRKEVASWHFRDCPTCPLMVTVADESASTARSKSWVGPAIGAYEVTIREYEECVKAKACQARDYDRSGTDNLPVTGVSQHDAAAYAAWIGKLTSLRYRLPTSPEWQRAFETGQTFIQSDGARRRTASVPCESGNGYDLSGGIVLNYPWLPAACNDGFPMIAPVGMFLPNFLGAYDMQGNVWEWTGTCSADNRVDKKDACEKYLLKGGSWASPPSAMSSASFLEAEANLSGETIGFRLYREGTR